MSRFTATVVFLGLALLAAPAAAPARWTHPIPLESGRTYTPAAVSIDGRGDAVVALVNTSQVPPPALWKKCASEEHRPPACFPIVALKVAVYTANGQLFIHPLWRQRVNGLMRIAVASSRGEATVAWSYEQQDGRYQSVRAAYGPLKGRWQPSRLLGHYSDRWFGGGRETVYPQLAVAPDGSVLAAWSACPSVKACPRPVGGVELARRAHGRGFSAPELVREAPEGARAVFDVAGTGYLYSPCSGRVLMSSPGSRRFARIVTLARGPVSDLALGTSGAGEGLATWVAGACSTDQAVGNLPGAVLASALKGGVFAAPTVLTGPGVQAYGARSAAVPGGGVASWRTTGSNGVAVPALQTVGGPGPFAPVPADSEPLASDGGGDILFTPSPIWPSEPMTQLVLPRRGAPAEPAPSNTGELAAAPFARLAVDAFFSSGPKLSVWRSEMLP